MKTSVKVYLAVVFLISLVFLFFSFKNFLDSGVDLNQIFLTLSMAVLLVFVNQKIAEDVNTKTAFVVLIPLLLPAAIFLDSTFVFFMIVSSFLVIYFERPPIKKLFNMATGWISIYLITMLYKVIQYYFNLNFDTEAQFVVILFILGACFNTINNLLVYTIVSLEQGRWNRNSLIPLMIVSKSTLINIIFGTINVFAYYYFGVLGLLLFSVLIFAAKPLLYHYISDNRDSSL